MGLRSPTDDMRQFIASREGMQLALGFLRIKEPQVRRRVLDLARALADGQDAAAV
jgi:hypothetical protein